MVHRGIKIAGAYIIYAYAREKLIPQCNASIVEPLAVLLSTTVTQKRMAKNMVKNEEKASAINEGQNQNRVRGK